jgi:FkbM family methyltransferase
MIEKIKASILDKGDNEFSVGFERVDFESGEIFFVPKYASSRPASKRVLNKVFYEPDTHRLVPKLLAERPGDMVHAGTFFGDMLPTFSQASEHTIYAFEPVLENYLLAKMCVEANELENVFLLNAALGASTGIVKMNTGGVSEAHRGGASQVGHIGQRTAMLTIDNLGLSNASIIQLDVEGFELSALRGAAQTIERNSPVIMIEDNSNDCGDYLKKLEYKYCGKIPGLSVWARNKYMSRVSELILSI